MRGERERRVLTFYVRFGFGLGASSQEPRSQSRRGLSSLCVFVWLLQGDVTISRLLCCCCIRTSSLVLSSPRSRHLLFCCCRNKLSFSSSRSARPLLLLLLASARFCSSFRSYKLYFLASACVCVFLNQMLCISSDLVSVQERRERRVSDEKGRRRTSSKRRKGGREKY